MKARLDFSTVGFGTLIENSIPVNDMDVVTKMLEQLKRDEKRLLIIIDQVIDAFVKENGEPIGII